MARQRLLEHVESVLEFGGLCSTVSDVLLELDPFSIELFSLLLSIAFAEFCINLPFQIILLRFQVLIFFVDFLQNVLNTGRKSAQYPLRKNRRLS